MADKENKTKRGFAAMPKEKQQKMASEGGKKSHSNDQQNS